MPEFEASPSQARPHKPIHLLDASIYIFRSYFSMPDAWHNDDGYSLNAVYGYTHFLLKFLHKVRPHRMAAAFDESLGSCFRNDIYPDYKASRALPDDSLAFQLQACRRVTELMGIASFSDVRYEADDIIATLARKSRRAKHSICVVTRDKDLAQLIQEPGDCLWEFVDDIRTDAAGVEKKFGVYPSQLIDYQTLLGDSIDDVPGVPGIGAKTASKLLQHFGSLDGVLDSLESLHSKKWRGGKGLAVKLDEYRDQMAMSKQLVTLAVDMPLKVKLAELDWKLPSPTPLQEYLQGIGLDGRIHSTIERSPLFSGAKM